MAALNYRAQQLVVSAIGALLLLPLDFFMGGIFSFSFAARDSVWAWAFGLTAFWGQIFCVLASFFKPRTAAACMLVDVGISCCIWLGCGMAARTSGLGVARLSASYWMNYAPGLLPTAALFWAAPMAFAMLLLRSDHLAHRRMQAMPVAKN